MPSQRNHDLWTVKEAAYWSRLSVSTIRRLVRSRVIPASHIGKSVRIHRRVFCELLSKVVTHAQ